MTTAPRSRRPGDERRRLKSLRRRERPLLDRGAGAVARAAIVAAIATAIAERELTQIQAAKVCGVDQPTLSKVLRGRLVNVTIDRLLGWLLALGRSVDIRVGSMDLRHPAKLTAGLARTPRDSAIDA